MAKFKEFERRIKFKPRLKFGWFHLKLYQMFYKTFDSRFKPALNLNRVLADLNRGSNSLNLATGGLRLLKFKVALYQMASGCKG